MPIHVEFVSPERVVFEADASQIIVRTTDGEIGMQPGHVPFVGVLAVAEARVYQVDGPLLRFAVHRGFVEIANDHCTILSDVAEAAEDIDVARAQDAKGRAEQAIARDADDEEAAAALARAETRISVASGAGPGGH